MSARDVIWGSLHNTRDLGGLRTPAGETRFGRLYRSPSPDDLDARAWSEVEGDGITTLVDLRNDYEVGTETLRPDALTVLRRPIEDQSDERFMVEWGHRLGSPLYYPEVLRRWPGLVADVFRGVAEAPDGGILIHCLAGRDRTGMIVAMLLQLVAAERTSILDDYEAGVRAENSWLRLGLANHREQPMSDSVLDSHLVVARAELTEFLDGIDVSSFLVAAGVTPEQLDRIRTRLLDA